MSRPPFPPFTAETAAQKARMAEDAWNSCDPAGVALAYVQHRGGAAGFLKVLDDRTLGFADFAGNRQFITAGNLAENLKAYLFFVD